jgi:hypothetical protein
MFSARAVLEACRAYLQYRRRSTDYESRALWAAAAERSCRGVGGKDTAPGCPVTRRRDHFHHNMSCLRKALNLQREVGIATPNYATISHAADRPWTFQLKFGRMCPRRACHTLSTRRAARCLTVSRYRASDLPSARSSGCSGNRCNKSRSRARRYRASRQR